MGNARNKKISLFMFLEGSSVKLQLGCQRFCTNRRVRRDIINTLATVGLWNSGILYLAAPIPVLPKFRPNEGVNNFESRSVKTLF